MTAEIYFVDTSIPIYAAGKPGEHKQTCSRLLEKVEARELEAVIDTEVIQEILYRFHRLEMTRQGLELSGNVLRLGMRVLPVSKRDIEETLVLLERHSASKVPSRDALHAAVMLNNGITKVVTLDRHFGDAIKEVQRIEPSSLLQ
jgi:predicted nucleic acid-binding protein